MGSPVKTPAAPQKQKGKENKIFKLVVELDEHVDFHSFESTGNMNSLIAFWGAPRQKGGKQALERPFMDESREKQEEEVHKVEKLSKEFLALVDISYVFVV